MRIAKVFTDVKGGNGLEKIGGFKGCKQLKNITIPDSVKIIDSSAFMECRSLTTVKGGANVEKIYKEAFCWCPQLKNIIIPEYCKRNWNVCFFGVS